MDSIPTIILTIVITALGSSGLWSYLQHRMDKKSKISEMLNSIKEQLDDVNKKIDDVNEKIDESDAKQARINILRFDDELSAEMKHSRDYFRQILEDIHIYEEYCRTHESFKNGYTKIAAEHIRETYDQLWREHKI